MDDVGAYWDNAVVERFFGSLKHDWIFKVSTNKGVYEARCDGLHEILQLRASSFC